MLPLIQSRPPIESIDLGIAVPSFARGGPKKRGGEIGPPVRALDRFDFGLFFRDGLVDFADETVRQLLRLFLGMMGLVLGNQLFFLKRLHGLNPLVADIADRDPPLLGHAPDHLGELDPPLLGKVRDLDPQEFPVIRRREPQIGF